jgi:hypothetical protein
LERLAFYEAVAPLAKAELAQLEQAGEEALARLRIDSVEVADSDDLGPHIAVLFRDANRPACRFGWRWAWREADPQPGDAAFGAGLLRVNLEEDILAEGYGLPEPCAEDAVTWF